MSAPTKKITYLLLALGLTSIIILVAFSNKDAINETDKNSKSTLKLAADLYIPSNVSFCDEPVPLENFDIKESLERELFVNVYFQSQTIQFVKYVHRFFPIMDSIFNAYHIPLDFKYLALAESGLRVNISPKGAAGFWQFLETTAKENGLTVSEEIDERYDIEKSTEAACKYLQSAYKKFGNWTLVAASYNLGMSGLTSQMKYQDITSYYDLHTNSETGRYVFRIISLKLILENPEKYGYDSLTEFPKIKYTTLSVDSNITNLAEFATKQGSNYKILKLMNPWLRGKSLPNSTNKKYKIIIVKNNDRKIDYKN